MQLQPEVCSPTQLGRGATTAADGRESQGLRLQVRELKVACSLALLCE